MQETQKCCGWIQKDTSCTKYTYLFIGQKKKKVKGWIQIPLLNDCRNLRPIAFLALLER